MKLQPLLLLVLSIPAASYSTEPAASPSPPPDRKAILVTGASSGFGRRIAERLAADGHLVYATARKDADLAALGAIPNVKPLRLDVTKPDEIAAAVRTVTESGRGLYALVNNAGIATGGPVARTSDAEFQRVMDVNALGVLRVTRAFLPLIEASKGRVVNISSLAGIAGYAGGSIYAMSKHAVEAFSDALAAEVAPAGVAVSAVEPGNFRTELIANIVKRVQEAPTPNPALLAALGERAKAKAQEKDPEEVAQTVKRALFDERPQRRYLIVPHRGESDLFIRKHVEKLVQLNQNHPYSLSRDELVAMLDAALADAKRQEPKR